MASLIINSKKLFARIFINLVIYMSYLRLIDDKTHKIINLTIRNLIYLKITYLIAIIKIFK